MYRPERREKRVWNRESSLVWLCEARNCSKWENEKEWKRDRKKKREREKKREKEEPVYIAKKEI